MLVASIPIVWLLAQVASFEELSQRAQAALDSRPAEAADLYRQALGLRPDWAEGWFYFGGALYQLERYAEAGDSFRKVVEMVPKNGPAWAFLGLAEAELKADEQAIAHIRKGEELGLGGNRGFEVAVRVKAAHVLARSSAFDEAFLQLEPLSWRDERSPAVAEAMGLCALAMPYSLPDLPPERRAVVRQAGQAAWALVSHRPAEAAAAYKELLERYPNEPGVHYAYSLYLTSTDPSAAFAECQKELANTPGHWPALLAVISVQNRQGRPDLALQSLERIRKIIPARYRWLLHAETGRAHMTADRLEAAIPEFEQAVQLSPASAQLHFLLAQAYRRAGKAENARQETAEFERLKTQEDPLAVSVLHAFSAGKN